MAFLTVFLLAIVVGYPIWDHFYLKKIKGQQVSKWRMYGEIMAAQWAIVLILFLYWKISKRGMNELFVYQKPFLSINKEMLLAMGTGVLLATVMLLLMVRFVKPVRAKISRMQQVEGIGFLLPKTLKERWLFLFVSITAGVCEEIIFRGAMVYYLTNCFDQLPILLIGVISSILFGVVHLYQGWKGVFLTSYMGMVLFLLFVGSGSLWLPILFHFLIDAKFVFWPQKK